MTRCPGKSLACQGGQTRPYRDPLDGRGTVFQMCEDCAAALNAMGAGLELVSGPLTRRIADLQPEPARWQPVWLRNLTARDETGRTVA